VSLNESVFKFKMITEEQSHEMHIQFTKWYNAEVVQQSQLIFRMGVTCFSEIEPNSSI
jgi:hypothetical protein